MYKSIIISLFLIISFSLFCQTNNDSIKKVNFVLSNFYKYNGQILTFKKMSTLMNGNVLATSYLNKAKTSNGLGFIFCLGGSYSFGSVISHAIRSKELNWAMFAVGFGFTAVYVPIVISTNKNVKLAVDTYNRDKILSSNNENECDLKIGVTQNGFGIILKW